METKEEKKERKQSYFARLKKKKLAKQNADVPPPNTCGTHTCKTLTGKSDGSKIILEQTNSSQENYKHSAEKEDYEKKKKKSSQPKDIRRTDLKRYYSIGEFKGSSTSMLCHDFSVSEVAGNCPGIN
uniref:Uncharacterized protein n=1 Tax=Micrurus carvalhoi TaxID=3147026 RepID=A0A2H6N7W6_9SAUR